MTLDSSGTETLCQCLVSFYLGEGIGQVKLTSKLADLIDFMALNCISVDGRFKHKALVCDDFGCHDGVEDALGVHGHPQIDIFSIAFEQVLDVDACIKSSSRPGT
ncbi:hypothetical protein FVE85_5150 [Porphyridium purpureum]|uniref:Uncharacterized protein n=1 Tax=Porphyridium purpureum TaxID=35688 RepID=A0A5J4Z2N2_PORPP|nr:hypothetical protein FVE85_5150 [Porphyridium purpureum]|eukprot:POR1555..scf295_1